MSKDGFWLLSSWLSLTRQSPTQVWVVSKAETLCVVKQHFICRGISDGTSYEDLFLKTGMLPATVDD